MKVIYCIPILMVLWILFILKKQLIKVFMKEKNIWLSYSWYDRGAIDPIKDISKICKERNIWMHIDGSIGGIFALTNIKINELSNVNKCNSITINPQKILGITKTSSLLIVSDFKKLNNAFATGLPYIASDNEIIDRGEYGVQGSRSAEIIKLWLGLRFLGITGIEKILNSSIKRKIF